jgi:transcriptional regulator with XRE-family HTH domain
MIRARDSISEKIDHLFRTVRRDDNREFTYDDVERGTQGQVSRSYVWKLRHGRNRNPSLDVIESLSEFFSVPPAYFFGQSIEGDARAQELAETAALFKDPAARLVAECARGLSAASLEAVVNLLENLHAIERSRVSVGKATPRAASAEVSSRSTAKVGS